MWFIATCHNFFSLIGIICYLFFWALAFGCYSLTFPSSWQSFSVFQLTEIFKYNLLRLWPFHDYYKCRQVIYPTCSKKLHKNLSNTSHAIVFVSFISRDIFFQIWQKNVSKILAVSSNTCLDQLSLLDRKNVFQLFYSMEGPLFTTIFHMFKFI